jgi:hypothetical protein
MENNKEFTSKELDNFINSYIILDDLSKKILESESRSICEYIELFELGLKRYAGSPKSLKDSLEPPTKMDSFLIKRVTNYQD